MNVRLRPIQESDRPQIEAISAQIWDGEDYVPEALARWLADADGEIVGAELDGRLVAFARRTWLCPGHAWFEGIRTDPAYQGRGIARAITAHLIDSARDAGAQRIHLSTYYENESSIHIIETSGFSRVASFAFLEHDICEDATSIEDDPSAMDISLDEATAFVGASDFLRIAGWRFPRGWRFFPFDVDPCEATARLATCIGIRRDGQLVALACVRQPALETGPVTLNFADGTPEALPALLAEVHRRYAGRNLMTMVPKSETEAAPVLDLLKTLGYTSWDDYRAGVFVYEKPL